jgi:hypothetical protein
MREIGQYFDNYWDLGSIIDTIDYNGILEWIINHNDVDLGTFVGAGVVSSTIDLGTFV